MMDKNNFFKNLIVIGLINSVIIAVISGLIYLFVMAIITVPYVVLTITFFVIFGYVSAYIYLVLKGKE